MMRRILPVAGALFFLAVLNTRAYTDDKPETHEGIVVKVEDAKLTMTDNDGKNEHSHDVAVDAKITCDGKECKLKDLEKGYKVKVTTEMKDSKRVATMIEAKKGSS